MIGESLEPYKRVYRKLGLDYPLKSDSKHPGLVIERVHFVLKPFFYDRYHRHGYGVLAPLLPLHERRRLRDKRISYLTLGGQFSLALPDKTLTIEPTLGQDDEATYMRRRPRFSLPHFGERKDWPRPTLFVSPNGFRILDALFRLPREELKAHRAALPFAEKFHLSRPKLSTMMATLGAKSILALKEEIERLSLDWWLYALDYPPTKKRLTPFFEVAEPYYSRKRQMDAQGAWSREVCSAVSGVLFGPPHLLTQVGLLSDRSFYFWVNRENMRALKKELELVPGHHPERIHYYLASPRHGFMEESLQSSIPSVGSVTLGDAPFNLNPFRVAWDLSFGDERLRGLRKDLLGRIVRGEGPLLDRMLRRTSK